MRRMAPIWFTQGKGLETCSKYWPWGVGAVLAGMYWYQPAPFDEVASSTLTMVKRPLLRGTEWLEVKDVDPESLVLELPPDMVFGPLPVKQQMDFLLHALKNDNELADGYITRLIIDHMDVSLDPAPLGNILVDNRAKELLEFAVKDFTGQRQPRKNTFFGGDQFVRLISILSPHAELATFFVDQCNGLRLLFKALSESTEEYARVLVMRSVTLFALMQQKDGDVERQLLSENLVPKIVDCYRQCTGDATDTRFVTMIMSSMLRHYPEAAAKELHDAGVIRAAVDGINIARYKGLPQHYRILRDFRQLPADVKKKLNINVAKELLDHDFIAVASGVIDIFPEYQESLDALVDLLSDLKPHAKPIQYVEYRVLASCAKALYRQSFEPHFADKGGTMEKMLDLCHWICNDAEVKPYLTGGPLEVQAAWRTIQKYTTEIAEKQEKKAKELAAADAAAAAMTS